MTLLRPTMPQPVRRVVVLTKHRFMGDAIVAVPLLRAARQTFPEARITLVTGRLAAEALQHCPYADETILYDASDPRCRNRSLLRAVLGGGRADVCLLVDRSLRSACIACCLRAPVRAGFTSEGRGLLLTHRVPYRREGSEIQCFLDVLRSLVPEGKDAPAYDPTPELTLTDAERERGARILAEREAIGPVLVGIQPGASYPEKRWSIERYAAVASSLAADGAGIVLLGAGQAEIEIARRVRQAMQDIPVIDLTGAASLRETMGALAHLSLFIGNDTGLSHVAASLGIPTLTLFGPTSSAKWGHTGPLHAILDAPEGDLAQLETTPVREAARQLLRSGINCFAISTGAGR